MWIFFSLVIGDKKHTTGQDETYTGICVDDKDTAQTRQTSIPCQKNKKEQ
jgi:hypothetical protein